MNDPVVAASPRAPTPKRVTLQTPGVEKPMVSISPEPPSASEPEGVVSPEDLALVPRRQPSPSRVSPQVMEDLTTPPLVDAYLLGAPALLDLSSLESLEMTISHTLAMGEVHYYLQAQSLARITLPSTSIQRYLGLSSRDKEP